MRKLVWFMHTSLDGFVAGPGGEMDWIYVDDEMFEYAGDQTDNSDTALYGRVTWQMMDNYWPDAGKKPDATKHDKQHSSWYNQVEKVVLSKTMKGANLVNAHIISDDVGRKILALKQKPGKNILMLGSPSASHALVTENLIDEFWLFVNPILIGKGIPLFKNIEEKKKLKFINSHIFSSGVVLLHYEIGPR